MDLPLFTLKTVGIIHSLKKRKNLLRRSNFSLLHNLVNDWWPLTIHEIWWFLKNKQEQANLLTLAPSWKCDFLLHLFFCFFVVSFLIPPIIGPILLYWISRLDVVSNESKPKTTDLNHKISLYNNKITNCWQWLCWCHNQHDDAQSSSSSLIWTKQIILYHSTVLRYLSVYESQHIKVWFLYNIYNTLQYWLLPGACGFI